MMKLQDSDHRSSADMSLFAGSSSSSTSFDGAVLPTNGRTNGFTTAANGSSSNGAVMGNGVQKHGKAVARVNLPGQFLYDDSCVDRKEFVRLVIQSLRDVGYIESAATLEAESGYTMESSEVSQFRRYILEGMWSKAEAALSRLGVESEDALLDAKFLISRQKYLELLEAKKSTSALKVLRDEIARLNVDSDQLHTLSSLIMCSEPEDLRRKAEWDGASGGSRRLLLETLQEYVPSTVMIPPRRFATLLDQARAYQRQQCTYHNSDWDPTTFSLYTDHRCSKADFPRITTTILDVHEDEVWNIAWSHDGAYLASASKDKTAIIWRRGSTLDSGSSHQDWTRHHVLRDHPDAVGCLAWSLDDSILLASAEGFIRMWDTKTGTQIRTLDKHTDVVTAMAWLPDGTGFISGGLDRRITVWDADGRIRESWPLSAIRITNFALVPSTNQLVAVGMEYSATPDETPAATAGNSPAQPPGSRPANRFVVYDLATKQTVSSTRLEGELTSVQISKDSQYALVNHSPNEVQLWDISTARIARRYTGQVQGKHVIRSCFGGIDGNFVLSGSEDANIYIWHRDTGTLLEVLSGHGQGSVNAVAWNPTNERMFASCSDDNTVRVWEAFPAGVIVDSPTSHPASLPPTNGESEQGKGKMRQRQEGTATASGSFEL